MGPQEPLPKILFVDDEPNVLEAIQRQLHSFFDVRTAIGGELGLATIEREGPFAVVVSDMRMPGMNGAVFLRHVRERSPNSVRLLLTGQADLETAIGAVNEGQIFHFLRKPCPPNVLHVALTAAVGQHRLITAEKELLERTLLGSVGALSETLALVSPTTFGTSVRIRGLVGEIAKAMSLLNAWEVEVAATMAQLGVVTLPDALIEKLAVGAPLAANEQALVAGLPNAVDRLLAKIPRLEGVRAIIRAQYAQFGGGGTPADLTGVAIPVGARVLKVATDFDAFESSGMSATDAVARMQAHPTAYDPSVLGALAKATALRTNTEVTVIPVDDLVPGMVFAQDVVLTTGALLIARGQQATPTLLFRLRVYRASLQSDRLAVRVG